MEKIIIIGASGSGKSTFAAQLAQKLNLPLYHLDRIFWRANWQSIPREDFIAEQKRICASKQWIIDGHYRSSLELRASECDTIFLFALPRRVYFFRALMRIIKSFGKVRPDMADDCPEQLDLEFLHYVWTFSKVHDEHTRSILQNHASNKQIIVFSHPRDAARFIADMPNTNLNTP